MFYLSLHDNSASSGTFTDEANVRDRWWNINFGDVVLDVGAGYGSYALTACPKASMVYAFSPTHDHYELLARNIKVNNFSNCEPVKLGLYSKDGYWNERTGEFSDIPLDDPLSFPVTTMDKFVESRGIDRVDWIKLDVEGAEVEVLKGAEKTLKGVSNILIENHVDKIADVEQQCQTILKGYNCQTILYFIVSHSLYTRR